jgi:hypothetical protein
MKRISKWSSRVVLAGLLWLFPVVSFASPSASEIDSPGGMAAAILCGLYIAAAGPVAGIIAGLISSCGWLLFDAIYL